MALLGGYPRSEFATKMAAAAPGVPLDVDRIFVQTDAWGSGEWNDVVASIAAKRVVIVSTKLSGSWASAATGSNDARMDAVVNGLVALPGVKALPYTPCLAFNHEPENDGPSPADYQRMQAHFDQRYAAKLRAAGWDLCLIYMGGTWRGWTPWSVAQVEQSFAGTSITKVFADIYEKPGTPYATKAWTDPDSTSSPFRAYADWIEAKGLHGGLPEIGCNRKQTDDGSQGTFLEALADSRCGKMDCFVYYNRDVGEGGATSNTKLLRTDCFEAFAGLYGAVTPEPEPEPEPDCAEVEAELAALQAEHVTLEGALTSTQAQLAAVEAERDALAARIDAAVNALTG
jgi:hypothetical protein